MGTEMLRLAILALLLLASPASAQTAVNCPLYNTTTLSVFGSSVISDCTVNVGPKGVAFLSVTGELSCATSAGGNAALVMTMVTAASSGGTARPKGASFTGSITGGVLTVTGMITPGSFIIEQNDYIFDAQNGAGIPKTINGSNLQVGTQRDGTTGGVGHYNVSDATVTVASETLWALYNYNPRQNTPTASVQLSPGIMEQLQCINGKTYLTMQNAVIRNDLPNNTNTVLLLSLFSENISGNPPSTATFNNGQISVAVPGTITGSATGGIVQ